MDNVTLTIHFKNRVRLFYPKHLPGPQLTMQVIFYILYTVVDDILTHKLHLSALNNMYLLFPTLIIIAMSLSLISISWCNRAIQKTFELCSEDEVELVDHLSHERLSLTKLHCLPPNSHVVSTLVIKHGVSDN